MPYELEQGIYFTSFPAFERTNGLGMTAASQTDAQALEEMRRIASAVDFYEDQTEYSFLYSPVLGFCTTATTIRISAADKRATPYIHMVFSERHPADDPEGYGFSARFETGEYHTLEGEIPPLKVEALPTQELFHASASQVAWLIQRLWSALCAPNIGDVSLLLSPDGLPFHWSPAERLMQVVRKLAELVPASLRQNIRATTAPLYGKKQWSFNILLSRASEAVRLDNLPVLTPAENDYFGILCVKMAESYLNDQEEFRTLSNWVDQEALTKVKQIDTQRYALAACCAATALRCRWALDGQGLEAAYERVRGLIRNDRTDWQFWTEQEERLRPFVPPKTLPELLKWFQDFDTPPEKQTELLCRCYRVSPEAFVEQFHHVDEKNRRALTALWDSQEIDSLIRKLGSHDWNSPKGFYRNLCEQLTFWTPLIPEGGTADKPKAYFSDLLKEAPLATLEEMEPLFHTSRVLLQWDSQIHQLERAMREEKRLPPYKRLEVVPYELLHEQSVKSALKELWKRAEKELSTRELREDWMKIGKLLGFLNEQAYYTHLEQTIGQLRTSDDVVHFAEEVLNSLTIKETNAFYNRVSRLIENFSELEDLLPLEKALKNHASSKGYGYFQGILDRKLKNARLKDQILHASLRELLDMAASRETADLIRSRKELLDLWSKRVGGFQDVAGDGEQLTREDRGLLIQSIRWMECSNLSKLVPGLCRYYFMTCFTSLHDLRGAEYSGCWSYNTIFEEHLKYLARSASLDELYEFATSGAEFDVQCPPETWAALTPKERLEILSKWAKDPNARYYYKKLLSSEDAFCQLLLRLYDQSRASAPLREIEWDMLCDCMFEAAMADPEDWEVFSLLLTCWKNSVYRPTQAQCRGFVQRMMAEPLAAKKKRKRIFQRWKAVFKGTDCEKLLKAEWKRGGGDTYIGGPAEIRETVEQDLKLEDGQKDTKQNGKGAHGALAFFISVDRAIYDFFMLLSLIPRFPIRLIIAILNRSSKKGERE